MFYPNHHIRTYCIYLGSLAIHEDKCDLGVYIHPDKSVSHAIVFGNEDSQYLSGEFVFKGRWLDEAYRMKSTLYKINEELYKDYLNFPSDFPQPPIFKQRT